MLPESEGVVLDELTTAQYPFWELCAIVTVSVIAQTTPTVVPTILVRAWECTLLNLQRKWLNCQVRNSIIFAHA